ncbi:MAG: hypothetical protein JNG84_07090 [Archangium sp.]|nr:hypothetical protein [Archangium sp.]
MRLWLVGLCIALSSCRAADVSAVVDAGCAPEPLFGQPIAATGLDETQCTPSCATCGSFTSPDFTDERLEALTQWTLTTPVAELTTTPYDAPPPPNDGVCAVVVDDLAARSYHLQTFTDVAEADAAGAILTHHDACGVCSTLKDFVVYARERDVGSKVKKCGYDSFGKSFSFLVGCIEAIGFTTPCAQMWAYNTDNTRAQCFSPCIFGDQSVYQYADGRLNDCLACDEEKSGPVFKAVAGRTRRNTGLATSICRPCSEVRPVAHAYP